MTTEPTEMSAGFSNQLNQSEATFRTLVSGVKDYAIFMLSPDGFIRTWNEGAERLKGYRPDEIIGKHFSIFYSEEERARKHPQHELEIAIEVGRYEEEGWRYRKDGSKFWANVVITALRDEEGTLVGFGKVTRDLTERKLSELQQQQAARQNTIFKSLVSGVKDYAIFMLDPEGNVMTWNDGAQRIKGYLPEEIIGKHFSTFYTEEALAKNHPQYELDIAAKEGRYEEEGWRVRKDGTTFWANVVITAIHEGRQLIGFAKVTRDLTERREAERQREANAQLLAQSNEELQRALEVKSRFLSTISHEVRTPMAGIIGMTELLTMQDLGEDNNEIVLSVFNSAKRLLVLLNDLLDAARMDSGKMKLEHRQFSVRPVLGDIRQLVQPDATKKGLELLGSCDADVPETLCGDEFRLRQILLNLAFNAVKFTSSGSVEINCCVAEKKDDVTKVRFTVKDTGIGIAPAAQSRLFEPFEQAESSTSRLFGGSGLGLSISKSLVDLMDGDLGVISEAGQGATFWFEIPFRENLCQL